MENHDDDELFEALGEILFWCFWPKNPWQWVVYIVLASLFSYYAHH